MPPAYHDRVLDSLLAAAADPANLFGRLPWLGPQLDRDRAHGLFEAWGASTVADENAGVPVLPESVVSALASRAGLAVQYPVANAGLLHVYGYLLSTVPTPYGFKRDRWLDGQLAVALGLDASAFLPWDLADGTLLERVTRAVHPVATGSRTDGVLHQREDQVAEGVTALTTLWRSRGSDAAALVYALDEGRGIRLITTFPVADPTSLIAGLEAPPRLRFNAVALTAR